MAMRDNANNVSAMIDAIVIGAGVMGSSISLELARSGRKVLCVDAGPGVGSGSTSSSSAVIRFNYSVMDSILTAWEAGHRWKNFASFLGAEDSSGLVEYVETGCLALDVPNDNRPKVLSMWAEIGIEFSELTADEIHERFPQFDKGDFYPPRTVEDPRFADDPKTDINGYWTPEGGFVNDPMLSAQNFMDAARKLGVEVRLNSEVVEIRKDAGAVVGITLADGEQIDAPIVVNAAGPASRHINALAGVVEEMRIKTNPMRQEVHVVPAPPSVTVENTPLVADAGVGVYFRPGLGGTVLIGSTEPECDELQWVDDHRDFNPIPTPEVFEAQVLRTARRIPELGIPSAPVGLADLYDASDDWVPLYDKSSLDGFFMACGTSGNQFKNAPMVGTFITALVDAAAAGQDHDVDPVKVTGELTGREINLATFSRLRERTSGTNSVLG